MFFQSDTVLEEFKREDSFWYENKDPQGIKWNTDKFPLNRETYLQEQLHNIARFNPDAIELCNQSLKNCRFFDFKSSIQIPCLINHSQIRRNIHSNHSDSLCILTRSNKIISYNTKSKTQSIVITPTFDVACFDVLQNYMFIGGTIGEIMLCDVNGKKLFTLNNQNNYSTINSSRIFENQGTISLMVSSNARAIQIIDPENGMLNRNFTFMHNVNDAAFSKHQSMIAASFDHYNDLVMDSSTGKTICTLEGHKSYCFSVEWDPSNEFMLATGSEDKTVMVWDIRQGSVCSPVYTLKGLSSGYSVKYSQNGKYLAFLEAKNLVNIYDKRTYQERQTVNFFGSTSGLCFDESDWNKLGLFIGICSEGTYSAVAEYHEHNEISFSI